MKIRDEIVLVSGANRGLGRALVETTLAAGARKIYAGAREPAQLEQVVALAPERIVPLALDITDARSLADAAERAPDVSVLFNNAGVLASYSVLASGDEQVAQDFATNTFGLLAATKAFLPALERAAKRGSDRAAVVNVLSIVSLTNMPALGGYSASKAAAYSLTQALRWELAPLGIAVHGVLAGAIDTDMIRAMDGPKTSPSDVARTIVRDVERGLADILPESASQGMFEVWRRDPRELERQLALASGAPTRIQ